MKVLIIEDDEMLRALLARQFGLDGNVVDQVGSIYQANTLLACSEFELLLVDWQLPDGDGLGVVSSYRAAGRAGAIVVITARQSAEDKIAALEAGADDVLVKPFHVKELLARSKAIARRPREWRQAVYTVGRLTVDSERQCAIVRGKVIDLTRKEWLLLRWLARSPGRVAGRAELVGHLWDENHEPDSHALEVHISNLRIKLRSAWSDVEIVTRRGSGYQLVPSQTARFVSS